ncbi:1,4-alpha-glucan branching protein GlgB [Clostridium fermenticellae]|uniref:1,4-alpha-glucan branching enzyme GlgB n=1 Tax=Clostridium fermenticellae TaxID=2068654 RepID=A0A386H3B0_9CLOT|nr:1,4-alpha-glucan branching protein GlgB [Clostridium fermenticellae]AYD40170.1 1,4-alpha-glucan branching protein GlgB [Clostridium fermenticellae]
MLNLDINYYEAYSYTNDDNFRTYKFLGSRFIKFNKTSGTLFRVWAPNALSVSVVGDFNNWNYKIHIMKKQPKTGFWNLFIEGIHEGYLYKYAILTSDGKSIFKSDPYAFYSEVRPNTASIVYSIKNDYKWNDQVWFEKKSKINSFSSPINIYEINLSSWRLNNQKKFYSYKEMADLLVPYILDMGYTHIELMPITEHPFDGSWGYQTTGYYSLTSRFGRPSDFKYFVDKFHQNNIGIIMDWVPGHFCKDSHGLYKFDGSYLYEYQNSDLRENCGWGTSNFDLGKTEVKNFLISNALFWFEIYHIDGIRVDAVANMLYLNYGKQDNPNLKNKHGGIENLDAVEFLRKLNRAIFTHFPNSLVIAEESTAWPMVTRPDYDGGLGFNYKWNMGWMNDILRYMSLNENEKIYNHNLITFSIMYAFSENFILPISHDEVVYGKRSLLNKMPGKYEEKFSGFRAFLGYMMTHPGKKLNFMGNEFAQFDEWKFDSELDWNLLLYPMHEKAKKYVKALNYLYRNESALWEQDFNFNGFNWIDVSNNKQCIISFIRQGISKYNFIIIICNFGFKSYDDFKIGVPRLVKYKELLNSDAAIYGGSDNLNREILFPGMEKWNSKPFCIKINLPALSTIFIKPIISSNESNFKLHEIHSKTEKSLKGGISNDKKRDHCNGTRRRSRYKVKRTHKV